MLGAILKFLKLLFAVIIVSDSFNDFDTYFEAQIHFLKTSFRKASVSPVTQIYLFFLIF